MTTWTWTGLRGRPGESAAANQHGPEPRHRETGHLAAAEYFEDGYISREDFNSLYRFAFVRNPFRRLVSEYLYRNYFNHRSFADFVMNRLPEPGWDDKYRHVMPQYDMLHDREGRLLVDFVGRFENLQADFDVVCEELGFEDSTLPHRNPSDKASRNARRKLRNWMWFNGENRKKHWSEYYDASTRQVVSDYYHRDIEAFGYSFEAA